MSSNMTYDTSTCLSGDESATLDLLHDIISVDINNSITNETFDDRESYSQDIRNLNEGAASQSFGYVNPHGSTNSCSISAGFNPTHSLFPSSAASAICDHDLVPFSRTDFVQNSYRNAVDLPPLNPDAVRTLIVHSASSIHKTHSLADPPGLLQLQLQPASTPRHYLSESNIHQRPPLPNLITTTVQPSSSFPCPSTSGVSPPSFPTRPTTQVPPSLRHAFNSHVSPSLFRNSTSQIRPSFHRLSTGSGGGSLSIHPGAIRSALISATNNNTITGFSPVSLGGRLQSDRYQVTTAQNLLVNARPSQLSPIARGPQREQAQPGHAEEVSHAKTVLTLVQPVELLQVRANSVRIRPQGQHLHSQVRPANLQAQPVISQQLRQSVQPVVVSEGLLERIDIESLLESFSSRDDGNLTAAAPPETQPFLVEVFPGSSTADVQRSKLFLPFTSGSSQSPTFANPAEFTLSDQFSALPSDSAPISNVTITTNCNNDEEEYEDLIISALGRFYNEDCANDEPTVESRLPCSVSSTSPDVVCNTLAPSDGLAFRDGARGTGRRPRSNSAAKLASAAVGKPCESLTVPGAGVLYSATAQSRLSSSEMRSPRIFGTEASETETSRSKSFGAETFGAARRVQRRTQSQQPVSSSTFLNSEADRRRRASNIEQSSETRCNDMNSRLERRREQNRRAARGCRKRKQERSLSVVKEYQDLTSTNTTLRYQIRQLRQEHESLQSALANHARTCTRPELLQPLSSYFVNVNISETIPPTTSAPSPQNRPASINSNASNPQAAGPGAGTSGGSGGQACGRYFDCNRFPIDDDDDNDDDDNDSDDDREVDQSELEEESEFCDS